MFVLFESLPLYFHDVLHGSFFFVWGLVVLEYITFGMAVLVSYAVLKLLLLFLVAVIIVIIVNRIFY
jgi:hypothetical protein